MPAFFGVLTSLVLFDGAAIWQVCQDYSMGSVRVVLVIVLCFLGAGITKGLFIYMPKKDKGEDEDDDDDTGYFEPDPPPTLPGIIPMPSFMRDFEPSAEPRELVLR